MNLSKVSIVLALSMVPLATGMKDFATRKVGELEKMYIGDCMAEQAPHGFYGAFLQPCEFTFYQASEDGSLRDACTDGMSAVVAEPVPMHWFFNLSDHFDKDDWDSISSDDFEDIADKLMLWPDQCVGVTPRCYPVDDPAIHQRLSQYFDSIPEDATHVKVNCQNDAQQLSQLMYSFADNFEHTMPTIVAWIVTVVLLALVLGVWGCYGILRLIRNWTSGSSTCEAKVIHVPMTKHSYVAIEDGMDDEKTKLLEKEVEFSSNITK